MSQTITYISQGKKVASISYRRVRWKDAVELPTYETAPLLTPYTVVFLEPTERSKFAILVFLTKMIADVKKLWGEEKVPWDFKIRVHTSLHADAMVAEIKDENTLSEIISLYKKGIPVGKKVEVVHALPFEIFTEKDGVYASIGDQDVVKVSRIYGEEYIPVPEELRKSYVVKLAEWR